MSRMNSFIFINYRCTTTIKSYIYLLKHFFCTIICIINIYIYFFPVYRDPIHCVDLKPLPKEPEHEKWKIKIKSSKSLYFMN